MNRFLTFLLLVVSAVAANAASPTLENFDQTHFRTNNPPPGIIRTRLSSSNFDQSGDTWSITNVSGATGASLWSNHVDGFMRVLPPNGENGIELTNVYIQKLLYNQGGNVWYGPLSSNLVAGMNELNPFNKNVLQLTGSSGTPTDTYVSLSGGDGPGSLLIVENYSAGFGFCITNGTPQWDNPAQTIILPNGDWCPSAEGEQIWLRQNGHADWVEVLRVITSGPGFAIINPTDNYLPVRQNANTFADSDLKNVVGSGVVSILNASSQPMIELEKTGELTVYGYTNAPGEGIITVNTYMDTTFSVNQGFSAIPSLAATASVTRRNSPAYMTTGYAWDSDDSVSRTFLGYLRQAPSTGTIPISMLEINNGILGSTFRGIGVSDTQDALLGGAIGGSPANTSRTTNFAYVVTVQGTPSGTPRYATSEFSPVTVDTSNNLLYFYSGGAWRQSSTGASSAANWTAEGTTNSTLAGIARANGGVFTNGITAGASPPSGAFVNLGTNAPSSYIIKSSSQSGITTNQGFNWTHSATWFDLDKAPDEVSIWGYNITPGGARQTAGANDTAIGLSIEGSYNTGGAEYAEHHLLYVDKTGTQRRPWSWRINKNNFEWVLNAKGSQFNFADATNSASYLALTPTVMNWRATDINTMPGIQFTSAASNNVQMVKLGGAATVDFFLTGFRNVNLGTANLIADAGNTLGGSSILNNNAFAWADATPLQKILIRPSVGVAVANDVQFKFSTTTASSGTAGSGLASGGSGVVRVSDASAGIGALVYSRQVLPKTGAYSVVSTNSNSVFSNEGAGALQINTLPAAVAGLTYTFVVQDADGLEVLAVGDDTIRIANSVTGAAGNIQTTTVGNTVTLCAINATEWIALSHEGTWTVSAP